MSQFGFDSELSIITHPCQLPSGDRTQLWKCMECAALLACLDICQFSIYHSLKIWLLKPGRAEQAPWLNKDLCVASPTVCCRAGGAVGLVWCLNPQGLDKDTCPVWCSVYLSVNTSTLQLWKVYRAWIQPSHYGTWCQVTDPLLPSASVRSCQTKQNAGTFSMINPLA